MLFMFIQFVLFYSVVGNEDPCFMAVRLPSDSKSFCKDAGKDEDSNDRMLIGDFNGDGRSDLFCHKHDGHIAEIYFDLQQTTKWAQHLYFCGTGQSHLMVADFNGDKKTDLLCVQYDGDRNIRILLSDENGHFDASTDAIYRSLNICKQANPHITLGDYDGDGKTDILCYKNNGNLSISYAKDEFAYETDMGINVCEGNDDMLYSGDFNGDGQSDVFCHTKTTLTIVTFANNSQSNIEWTSNRDWCTMSSSFILVGDINGDRYDDLVCKDTYDVITNTYIAKNIKSHSNSNEYFSFFGMSFCTNGGTRNFFIGHFNGDTKADLLCQSRVGTRQILVSLCG